LSHDAKPVLRQSIENDDRRLCVDIFERADGTFGFEEWRRDAEDGGRWRRIGQFGDRVLADRDEALSAAQAAIPWLVT
jgi:hypothetical protein